MWEGGDGGGGRGVEVCVVDAVAVVFAHVEVGYYRGDVGVGDVVGGAPDFEGGGGGGGGGGVGLNGFVNICICVCIRRRRGGERGKGEGMG